MYNNKSIMRKVNSRNVSVLVKIFLIALALYFYFGRIKMYLHRCLIHKNLHLNLILKTPNLNINFFYEVMAQFESCEKNAMAK